MNASLSKITNSVEEALEGMIRRANLVSGYLNRVVYQEYRIAQRKRWMQENDDPDFTGGPWAQLDAKYAEQKRKKYGDNPFGRGTKMLIASGRLFNSVVGPSGGDHHKIVDNKEIRIFTTVPYAKFVDEDRTFSSWSLVFKRRIYKGLRDYLTKSIIKEVKS